MNENNEKVQNSDDLIINNNNPLSVRVDNQYKEIFNILIKEKGFTKKQLLENMITSYAQNDTQKHREENINFANEINLISSSLNDILNVFTTITVKSQDTIGSIKSFYEQKFENMKVEIETLKNNLSVLQEKNNILELANNGLSLEKEKLMSTIEEFQQKDAASKNEINSLNKRNLDLLEQINVLRSTETENHVLKSETDKLSKEIDRLNKILKDKDFENDLLNKKVTQLHEDLNELNNKRTEELKEFESKIKLDAELNKKAELIKLQSDYNELQIKNIENLGKINKMQEEIFCLKSKVKDI
ncbi:hypothetical protein Cpap_1708 [Ruminiclostridium papyrosolvens DSM 2782]|uniref:Uncharacterized protein n=1 Tax=Ruminiclostridium papyrosolvens DSM 2782 TaxID=588581 RepID=F1TD79_9FIRM|nr:hypothetical protein [Ruminiclostridium papyrosolvens]EGD47517.1 hypothetical protein Cpap_1708 [Ruminiclostridium papyrosolvens DSM 2782]WES36535.1 hypothetical protein P0092_11375 [Ruminiclostridium papyrosolvens DSM 2782]